MVSVPTGEGSGRKALAGSPWGLVLTFKSLARSGEKHGEAEGWVSLQGKTQRGSKAGYFSDRLSGSGARRAVPTPRGCGQDPGSRRSPPPPPPPPGKTDPRRRRRREHWPVPFLSRWTASGCHRGPPRHGHRGPPHQHSAPTRLRVPGPRTHLSRGFSAVRP